MPNKDNVNQSIKIIYIPDTTVGATPTTYAAIDTLAFGSILAFNISVSTESFAQDMQIEFQQSDDLAFTSPEIILPDDIINPFGSFTITEFTPVRTARIPTWGFKSNTKRYFRMVSTNGVGNEVYAQMEFWMNIKPPGDF